MTASLSRAEHIPPLPRTSSSGRRDDRRVDRRDGCRDENAV